MDEHEGQQEGNVNAAECVSGTCRRSDRVAGRVQERQGHEVGHEGGAALPLEQLRMRRQRGPNGGGNKLLNGTGTQGLDGRLVSQETRWRRRLIVTLTPHSLTGQSSSGLRSGNRCAN